MKHSKIFVSAAIIFLTSTSLTFADNSNKVPYRDKVTVKVGQSVVVHGLRGKCGALPTKSDVSKMQKQYGNVQVGKIVAGKQGVRNSKSCGGATPVIEAVFVAQSKGRVAFELFGDPISITVK